MDNTWRDWLLLPEDTLALKRLRTYEKFVPKACFSLKVWKPQKQKLLHTILYRRMQSTITGTLHEEKVAPASPPPSYMIPSLTRVLRSH